MKEELEEQRCKREKHRCNHEKRQRLQRQLRRVLFPERLQLQTDRLKSERPTGNVPHRQAAGQKQSQTFQMRSSLAHGRRKEEPRRELQPLPEHIVEERSGHKTALKIRGRRYKAAWLKQRINCSKSSCRHKMRLWVSTAISTGAAGIGSAVAKAARSELREYDYVLWSMWCLLYMTMLVVQQMWFNIYN